MLIRPATPRDVPAVLTMVEKINALHESWDPDRYGFLPNVARMYRGWLTSRADDTGSVFIVAEREGARREADALAEARTPGEQAPGELVGFLVGTVDSGIPIYRVREFGFIHDVWVEPDYRHEGVARQMTM